MSATKLATLLTVIFTVSVVVVVAELLFLLLRRRRRRLKSSQPPISGDHQHPDHPTKELQLLRFFCLKTRTRVEPSEPPTENPDGSPPDDAVIDVFKLLEANGRSRFLCTIKEDDGEYVESTSTSVVDGVEVAAVTEKVSLKACLEAEAAEERDAKATHVEVEEAKRVLSSPCDSPMFFTPVGSPAGDGCSGGR